MGPERACDSATGWCAHIWKSFAHARRPMLWQGGMWGLREPATVRQVCPYMEIICICLGKGVWGLREPATMRQAWGYMGRERACDSATGGPKYGNHLHMHPGPCFGMGVYGA